MTALGIRLRRTGLSDLLMLAFLLTFAAAVVVFGMLALGWGVGQVSAIIYGFATAAIALANRCGHWPMKPLPSSKPPA